MSGHSKWSTIKHKKSALDAKRGKLFTKLIKAITVAAKRGGGDLETNPALRTAINNARVANMPNDNIVKAIKRGTGELDGVNYEEVFYEGYGPGGVAIYVHTLTDNKNRSAAEIRSIFSKNGGNLAGAGSVSWLFEAKGLIMVKSGDADEDAVMEAAIEAGAEDFTNNGEYYEILTEPQNFEAVREALQVKNIPISSADLTRIPKNEVKLGSEEAKRVMKLVDLLEDNDDVQNVYTNLDLPDDCL